jgi:hypothetical protein
MRILGVLVVAEVTARACTVPAKASMLPLAGDAGNVTPLPAKLPPMQTVPVPESGVANVLSAVSRGY